VLPHPSSSLLLHKSNTLLGLNSRFTALKSLTAALNRSAELFEQANGQLEDGLAIDDRIDADLSALPDGSQDRDRNGNGGHKWLPKAKSLWQKRGQSPFLPQALNLDQESDHGPGSPSPRRRELWEAASTGGLDA
jgi:hypothetical protein